jgi:hypothetical protein
MHFATIASPVILGVASLVAFVSVRSTSIADRVRSADREIVDAATVPERRHNLLAQVRGLQRRYVADTYAMMALLLSFVGFVAMGALDAFATNAACVAFALACIAGIVGFVLALYEVFTAPHTLNADIAYAEAVAREEQPANKPIGQA